MHKTLSPWLNWACKINCGVLICMSRWFQYLWPPTGFTSYGLHHLEGRAARGNLQSQKVIDIINQLKSVAGCCGVVSANNGSASWIRITDTLTKSLLLKRLFGVRMSYDFLRVINLPQTCWYILQTPVNYAFMETTFTSTNIHKFYGCIPSLQ